MTIHVRVEPEDLQKLDECAEARQTSRSEIVREGIRLVHEVIQMEQNEPKE